jgi:hypothetical protein
MADSDFKANQMNLPGKVLPAATNAPALTGAGAGMISLADSFAEQK